MDCVEHCLEFIDQRVPDAAAGSKRKYGLQFSGPVFIRLSQGGENLGYIAASAIGRRCEYLRTDSVKSELAIGGSKLLAGWSGVCPMFSGLM
jgi:hypothetical protein